MPALGAVVLPRRPAPLIASTVNTVCGQDGRRWTKNKPYAISFGQNCTRLLASTPTAVNFPCDYEELMQQVRDSSKAALSDSKKLLEIEFPTAGLESVSGDGEGGIEMTSSMQLIRRFAQSLVLGDQSAALRIFFPDSNELEFARKGEFGETRFQLDYLTKPSGLEDFGLGGFAKKLKLSDRVKPSDEMFIVAYPYFNVNEMLAVEELFQHSAEATGRPIIIFNGELDRIRSGYYPPFFYPKLAQLAKTFLPKFETAYYIHNFKGRDSGTLFRAYPGPWQVLQRVEDGKYVLVHEQSTMPPLKDVALNILPTGRK